MQIIGMWRTAELTFESSRTYANPYLDVDVEAVFLGPGGMEIRRPAYWDSDRTWRVRFAPTRPGTWRYRISSDQPSDDGLHGATGELECVEEQMDLAVYGRGFLRKGSGGGHLAYADGSPFFWLGDTRQTTFPTKTRRLAYPWSRLRRARPPCLPHKRER